MDKAEFIKSFGIDSRYKTDFGLEISGKKRFALRCVCGADVCRGWAIISEDNVDAHMDLYAPKGEINPITNVVKE